MSNTATIDRATLKKGIGRVGFFCLAFGAMIGVGWVTAMGPYNHRRVYIDPPGHYNASQPWCS
jgi:hypothetical protein